MKQLTRGEFLKRIGVSAVGLAGSMQWLGYASPGKPDPRNRKPNYIFILIDDMGWRDLACFGSTFYETPHIDRLAAQGMKFTDAYAAGPVCSPTRASIMTGKHPARLRLTNFIPGSEPRKNPKLTQPKFERQVALEEVTIAEALKPAGYVAGHIGKWHLGGAQFHPDKQGFDLSFVTGGDHVNWKVSPPFQSRAGYLADCLTDEAEKFIEANKDNPFFLYLCHFAVHIPLQAKQDYIGKFAAKAKPEEPQHNTTYAAMIQSVDESVGRVMKQLDRLGLADNTVVVFMSDNGGLAVKEGPNTPATSNAPLLAAKGYVYEGGIRVPLIVRWPGAVRPGSVCSVPVSSVDFYPTMLEIAGVQDDPNHVVDGESVVPLLKEAGGLKRDALYWHYPHYSNQGGLPGGAVRKGDYKLIEFYDDNHLELYNLKDDIGEKNNLAGKMPEKAAELHKMLRSWLREVNAQMPTPNLAYDPSKPSTGPNTPRGPAE